VRGDVLYLVVAGSGGDRVAAAARLDQIIEGAALDELALARALDQIWMPPVDPVRLRISD